MRAPGTGYDVLGTDDFVGAEWWQDAFGALHTAGKVVLSAFGLGEVAKQLEQAEANAGLLPEWAGGKAPPVEDALPPEVPDALLVQTAAEKQYQAAYQQHKAAPRTAVRKNPRQEQLDAMKRRLQQRGFVLGAAGLSDRVIAIRVKNALALAAGQGGSIGKVASWAIPKTVESRVVDEMAKRMQDDLRANKVDADVAVVSASALGTPAAPADDAQAFLRGAAVGAGAAVGVGLLWKVLSR